MIEDEPAAWAALSEAQRPRVMAAAVAICRFMDRDEPGEDRAGKSFCDGCEHGPGKKHGGSCCAFGLFGDIAAAAVVALEAMDAAPPA